MSERIPFSVSICVYGKDNPDYFDTALESIYNQTLLPDEVVLTVDGPVPEGIEKVIEKYESRDNFRVFRLAENMGHGNARRKGLSECRYDYVAIADADDINVKERFEKEIALFAQDRDLDAASSDFITFTGDVSNVISIQHLPVTDAQIKKYIKTRCPLCQPSVMFKKASVEKAGGYLDWHMCEDYYLWLRMYLCGCKFANIPESLLFLRGGEDQTARRGGYKYFKSLKRLFKYMLKEKIIGVPLYLFNVLSRFVLGVLMTNRVRAFVRKKTM